MPAGILFWIAVSFSTFQIITSFGIPLDAALHLEPEPQSFLGRRHGGLGGLADSCLPCAGAASLDGVLGWLAVAGRLRPHPQFGGQLPSQVVRAIHVGLPVPGRRRDGRQPPVRARPSLRIVGWGIGVAGFASGSTNGVSTTSCMVRAGELTQLDMVVGIAALVILIYLVWRVMGLALPIVAALFLAYCLFGH